MTVVLMPNKAVAAIPLQYRIIETPSTKPATAINNSNVVIGANQVSMGSKSLSPSGIVFNDINESGGIVGSLNVLNTISNRNETHAFIFESVLDMFNPNQPRVLTDIFLAGWSSSVAESINKWGHVVGTAKNGNNEERAFLYITDMITLGPFENTNYLAFAHDISDTRQVVGEYLGSDGEFHAYLRDENGFITYFNSLLKPLLAISSSAIKVNNNGIVIGNYKKADGLSASFVYDSQAQELRDIPALTGFSIVVADINDAGQIVGTLISDIDSSSNGFVFDDINGIIELNTHIEPNTNWVVPSAYAINNNGEIAVKGLQIKGASTIVRRIILSPFERIILNEKGKLFIDKPQGGEQFSRKIEISGTTMVALAKNQPALVHMYTQRNGIWKFDGILNLYDWGYSLRAGNTTNTLNIQLVGDLLVVGAPYDVLTKQPEGTEILSAGSVYIFRRVNTSWTLEKKLISNSPTTSGLFGRSLSLDFDLVEGETIAVADRRFDEATQRLFGTVTLYSNTGNGWIENTNIRPVENEQFFGVTIDLDGNFLAVGGTKVSVGGSTKEYVVYQKINANWVLQSELKFYLDNQYNNAEVKISGSRLAMIGGPSPYLNQQQVTTFRFNGDSWVLDDTLPTRFTRFTGQVESILLSGNLLVINERYQTHLYVHNGFFYELEKTFTPPEIQMSDGYGISAALDGKQLAVGAILFDPFAIIQNAGAIFLYSLCDKPCNNTFEADVSGVITGPSSVNIFDEVIYDITLSNLSSTNTATGIRLDDTLPEGSRYLAAVSSQECSEQRPREIVCTVDQLAAGAISQLQIAHTAPANVGLMTNKIIVNTLSPDPDKTNNTDSITIQVNSTGNPTVTILEPADSSVVTVSVGEPVWLRFDIDSWLMAEGLNNFRLYLNDTYQRTYFSEADINLGVFEPGNYKLSIKLADPQNVLTTVEATVIFDVVVLSPTITITSPTSISRAPGEISNLEILINNWYVSDLYAQLHWSLAGIDQGQLPVGSANIDMSALPDGTHKVEIYLIDSAGIKTLVVAKTEFSLATLQPVISIGLPLEPNAYIRGATDSLLVTVNTLNWSGAQQHYHVTLNGSEYPDVSGEQFNILFDQLNDGKNTITITLANADHTEVAESKSVSFYVLNPLITIVSPFNNTILERSDNYLLQVTTENLDSLLDKYRLDWFLNGLLMGTLENQQILFRDEQLKPGDNTLIVKLIDSNNPEIFVTESLPITFSVASGTESTSHDTTENKGESGGGGIIHPLYFLSLLFVLAVNARVRKIRQTRLN